MGKGDRKSKKGKLFKKSYGIKRPRKTKKFVKPEAEKPAEE